MGSELSGPFFLVQLKAHPKCIFIAIGSELLSGDVLESNAHWLQNQIKHLEIEMIRVEILEDKLSTLVAAIKNCLGEADVLIISGGLGPTDDDITREAVSKATEKPLYFNPEVWVEIQNIFKKRNKQAGKSNEKQALQPEDSNVLSNPLGTAPGFELMVGGTTIMTFPGVPSEFYAMAQKHLFSKYNAITAPAHFKLWGIGESDLMDLIHAKKLIPTDLPWGTIARKEGLSLRFYREATSHPKYLETLESVKTSLEQFIFTDQDLNPLELLAQKALELKIKLGLAESCTGGLVSQLFTNIPGSSNFFQGSIVAYQNEIKTSLLQVSEKILENHGAVSPECAEAMAHGCSKSLKSDLSLSVTGIAGPGGGSEAKPVGTVYIGVHYQNKTRHKHLKLNGTRQDIRERSVYSLCILALDLLKEIHG